MKLYLKSFFVFTFCLSIFFCSIAIAQKLPDSELSPNLENYKILPKDAASARKKFGEVYLLSDKIKERLPEVSDMLLHASLAGLIAVGDNATYKKLRSRLKDAGKFEQYTSNPCRNCEGIGFRVVQCGNCKGTGRCSISSCKDGKIRVPRIEGYEDVDCKKCNGTGICPACGGSGKRSETCPGCTRGRIQNKRTALDAYLKYIDSAVGFLKGDRSALTTAFESLDAQYSDIEERRKQKTAELKTSIVESRHGKTSGRIDIDTPNRYEIQAAKAAVNAIKWRAQVQALVQSINMSQLNTESALQWLKKLDEIENRALESSADYYKKSAYVIRMLFKENTKCAETAGIYAEIADLACKAYDDIIAELKRRAAAGDKQAEQLATTAELRKYRGDMIHWKNEEYRKSENTSAAESASRASN